MVKNPACKLGCQLPHSPPAQVCDLYSISKKIDEYFGCDLQDEYRKKPVSSSMITEQNKFPHIVKVIWMSQAQYQHVASGPLYSQSATVRESNEGLWVGTVVARGGGVENQDWWGPGLQFYQ